MNDASVHDRIKRHYQKYEPLLLIAFDRQSIAKEISNRKDPIDQTAFLKQLGDFIDKKLNEWKFKKPGDRRPLYWLWDANRRLNIEDPISTLYRNREYIRSLEKIPQPFQIALEYGAITLSGDTSTPYIWQLKVNQIQSFAKLTGMSIAGVCRLLLLPSGKPVSYNTVKTNPPTPLPLPFQEMVIQKQ